VSRPLGLVKAGVRRLETESPKGEKTMPVQQYVEPKHMRIKRIAPTLKAYAKYVEQYSRPLDSGLPEVLRFTADMLVGIQKEYVLTVWKDGRHKIWRSLDATYASDDPGWLCNLRLDYMLVLAAEQSAANDAGDRP
jgi:hypothetical protein